MLPLLSFQSAVPGLVSIGDRPIGRIEKDKAVSLPAADKTTLCVRFSPFCNHTEALYAQLTFSLTFYQGVLTPVASPYIHVSVWDDRLYVFTLFPPVLYAHALPVAIASLDLGDHFATVLEQNQPYLIVEHKRNEQPDLFHPLSLPGKNLVMEQVVLSGRKILLVGEKGIRLYAFFKSTSGYVPLWNGAAADWASEQDLLTVTQLLSVQPHQVMTSYAMAEGKLKAQNVRYTLRQKENPTPQRLCLEFLECVRFGVEAQCLALMTEGLKSGLSMADLKDFFGAFSAYYPSPYGKQIYALEYLEPGEINRIKQFTFQLEGSKIDNIEELT